MRLEEDHVEVPDLNHIHFPMPNHVHHAHIAALGNQHLNRHLRNLGAAHIMLNRHLHNGQGAAHIDASQLSWEKRCSPAPDCFILSVTNSEE